MTNQHRVIAAGMTANHLGNARVDVRKALAVLEDAHGCPLGTTCPVCGPARKALRLLEDASEAARAEYESSTEGGAR